ncbi:NAD(P)-binding protein [Mollisia scopiformis]|uniref:NAD(P)-binding protein n=1 Tax=Mollisia scopiformis TaxID=149040 RepID=A0A194X840_MOLSC|nr:NAD(P)-binding protein [Mollisia scopiformis]KUJ15972.1 NAD(P)-binding protein [Mollisia scopiformis]
MSKFIKNLIVQWTPLPYPTTSFTGQTIIVTGANVGLGFEASRHFVRLGAQKVILACRSLSKGEEARADIERTTGRKGVCEVWEVDMGDWDSVKAFATRVEGLERVDAVCENAGLAGFTFKSHPSGWDASVAVNVVGTFLLALNLLPVLRRSGVKYNMVPRLEITSSETHKWAKFEERNEPSIFEALKRTDQPEWEKERYPVTKLLEVFGARSLVEKMAAGPHANQKVIVNTVNPGFCKSSLARDAKGMMFVIFSMMKMFMARSTEMGSRTIVAAVAAGEESHGKYMSNCVVAPPSDLVLSEEGKKTGDRIWKELLDILEGIQPGISKNI